MRIEKVDPQAAPLELLRAWYECETEAAAELTPGEPPMPFDQALGYLRYPGGGDRHYWLARDGGRITGVARLSVFGPSFAFVEVNVRPDARRRGVGTALLQELTATARTGGVRSVVGHHAAPAGALFAARSGARDGHRDVRARLRLPTASLPDPELPAGVVLRSWVGRTPDELFDSHVVARDAMLDAPAPDGTVDPGWTAERQRETEEACLRRDRPARVTVALEHGEIVAFTDLRVSPPPASVAVTDDTATLRAARRRGLSTAVKLEALRRLRDERPDVEFVTTLNAEHNVAMRAVNAKLGFEPVVVLTTAVLDLDPG